MHKPNKKLDVVIVEASAITEEGGIIPGASVGASPELIQMADKVCIRIRDAEVANNNNYRVDHHRS